MPYTDDALPSDYGEPKLPRSKPRMQRMDPDSEEWEERANQLARSFAPEIVACKHCGGPVISGYCCSRCGSDDPR